MKKYYVLLFLTIFIERTFSQNRQIVMPNKPHKGYNIAEKDNGYWCAFEVGGGTTVMDNMKNVAMVAASFTNGYRFNQYLKVGAGLGLLYYPNNDNVRNKDTHFSIPVFLNLRGNFLSDEIRKTTPFWSVNVGVSTPDGMFFTPTIGLRIGEKRSAFLVSVAYTLRHLDSYPGNANNYSGLLLKLGWEF